MTRPKVDFSGIDEAGGEFDFNLESTISDAITNDMIQVEVWTKPCQNIGVEPIIRFTSASSQSSSDLLELSSTDAYETGDGDGTQTIRVNGRWKRDDTDFAGKLVDSEFYKELSDGSLVQVSLCVRYQLHVKASSGGFEANFLETPVIINIDFKAGINFGLGMNLVPNDDECLNELQEMSGGLDDLYSNGLLWSPGSVSSDPSSPLGPPTFGGGGGGGGSSQSSSTPEIRKKYKNRFKTSSASSDNHITVGSSSWAKTMIGTMVFLVVSLI